MSLCQSNKQDEVLHSCNLAPSDGLSDMNNSYKCYVVNNIKKLRIKSPKMSNAGEEKIPIILFLLENNKIDQIVKAMINQKASQVMLQEYHGSVSTATKNEEKQGKRQNQGKAHHHSVYGQHKKSSFENPKYYEDLELKQNLKQNLREKVPTQQERHEFWLEFTEIYQKPGFYHNLKDFNLPTDFQSIIEKDIMRTHSPLEVRIKAEEVLKIFAVYNPYLGYCQGMNLPVAFLIEQGFKNDEAFFILKRITESILPLNYYVNMDCVMAYLRIFFQILHITHPHCLVHLKNIMDQLQEEHLTALNFIFQYFINIFCTNRLPETLILFIWDFFLLEGVTVLFRAGLGLFDVLHDRILACNNYEEFNKLLKQYTLAKKEVHAIERKVKNMYINEGILHLLCEKFVDEKIAEKKTEREVYRSKNKENPIFRGGPRVLKEKCDSRWNFCPQVRENNSYHNFVYENFVFKSKHDVKVQEDYIEENRSSEYVLKSKHLHDISIDLLIGRIPHMCEPSCDLMTEASHGVEQNNYSEKKMLEQKSNKIQEIENPEEIFSSFLISEKINELLHLPLKNQCQINKSQERQSHVSLYSLRESKNEAFVSQKLQPVLARHGNEPPNNRVSNIDDLLNEYDWDEMFD